MANRQPPKNAKPKDEVEVVSDDSNALETPLVSEQDDQESERLLAEANEEFNLHVKNLVGTFVLEHIQGLEQRISDLEQLLAQPAGAVQFAAPDALVGNPNPAPVPTYYSGDANGQPGGVSWYEPPLG